MFVDILQSQEMSGSVLLRLQIVVCDTLLLEFLNKIVFTGQMLYLRGVEPALDNIHVKKNIMVLTCYI